jgi:hypothetical protein
MKIKIHDIHEQVGFYSYTYKMCMTSEVEAAIKEAIEKIKGLETIFNDKDMKKYTLQSHVIEILEGLIK